MQALFNIINIPLGYVMRFLANIFNNDFAAAVAIFTLLINIVLIPLSIKSQKSAVSQIRIKPKLDELKKKYGEDRQKMAQAQQELYQQEGVSMSGGCLPMLVRLALMMSIYWLILSPLTYIAQVEKADVTAVSTAITETMSEYEKDEPEKYAEFSKRMAKLRGTTESANKARAASNVDLLMTSIVRNDPEFVEDILPEDEYKKIEKAYKNIVEKDKESNINYMLFNNKDLDLTKTPTFSFDIFNQAQLLWIIPFGAFLAQILTSLISMRVNKINNPDAPSMMGMMLTMPLFSLFIGFGLPAGVGFYWICSSLIGGLIQSGVQLWYGPQKLLARERAKELATQCDFEAKQLDKFNNSESVHED